MALTWARKHGPLPYASNENFPGIHLHLLVLLGQPNILVSSLEPGLFGRLGTVLSYDSLGCSCHVK